MAQQTLLQMTQDILNSMDSDEVNSISDTAESLQVATIIKNKYYDLQTRSALPSQKVLFQLTPSTDPTKPVQMTLPTGASAIEWIKYYDSNPKDNQQISQFGSFSHNLNLDINNATNWTTKSTTTVTVSAALLNTNVAFTVASSTLPVLPNQGVLAASGTVSLFGTVVSYVGTTLTILVNNILGSGTFNAWTLTNTVAAGPPGYKYVTLTDIETFLDMVNRFNPTDSNVGSMTFAEVTQYFGTQNFTFLYKTNKQPQFCCVIENQYVLFDSFDSTFDTTLQGSKTMVRGYSVAPFNMVDSFIPDIDDNEFPLLFNEAKAQAFYELKQMPHALADRELKRQWSQVQKNKSKDNRPSYFNQLPDYGRVPRTGGFSSGGYGAYKWMRQAGP